MVKQEGGPQPRRFGKVGLEPSLTHDFISQDFLLN
jgi:hypothetical protein